MSDSILTVLTPAVSRDLTTLATLKDDFGITDNATDATLARYISETSAIIEDYTGQSFAAETVQEVFRRDWRALWGNIPPIHELRLARAPVISIASITEDDNPALDPATDYVLDAARGQLTRLWDGGLTWWRALVTTVIYTAGYPLLGDLPRSIEQACLLLCRHRWSARGRDPMVRVIDIPGVMRQEFWVGPTSGASASAFPPEVEALLAPHVQRNI